MTNLHKIRARIRSVNSTQQITRTMKMIAVSKLRKTQTSLAGVRLFADKSQAVLNALLAGDASFEHPYLCLLYTSPATVDSFWPMAT